MTAELFGDYLVQLAAVLVVRVTVRLFGKRSAAATLALNVLFFAALTTILLVHGIEPYDPVAAGDTGLSRAASGSATAIWWIAGSMVLVSLVRLFLIFERTPREGRLFQDVLVGIIFLGTALSIISYVFRIPVGTLIATSGVFAIVLGLALQNTLADVFSGVALNLGKPYRIGDWIVLDDGVQGRVVETNWRATHLLNSTNDLVVVPNSALAKARIVNHSSPDETHGISLVLRLRPGYAPAVVEDVMRTMLSSSNHILKHPDPAVKILSLDSVAIEVELIGRVKDISRTLAAKNELFDLAFRHARAAGLDLAPPSGTGVTNLSVSTPAERIGTAWRLVSTIPLFAPLTDDEKEELAKSLTKRVFERGTVISAEGSVVEVLSIVRSGVVVVERMVGDATIELTRLSPNDCFGERGVLTDAPEIATKRALTPVVIYEVSKEVLRPLMQGRKGFVDQLGMLSFRHTEHEGHVMADLERSNVHQSYSFAERIRHLFEMQEDA